MTFLVGTASWTDKTLVECGRFYPASCKTPEGRLRFYASQFPMVEVDSSYYAMPNAATAQLWAERTPPGFVFNIKAFRVFTGHVTETKVLPRDIAWALGAGRRHYYKGIPEEIRAELWKRFAEALEPLRLAGKLGMIHFQFPPAVRCSSEAMAHIEKCQDWLPRHTLSVRPAPGAHHRRRAAGGRQQRAGGVGDHPPDYLLLRLHGRNIASYNAPAQTAAERFDYDYPDRELAELAGELASVARKARNKHVVFNNCYEDQGSATRSPS